MRVAFALLSAAAVAAIFLGAQRTWPDLAQARMHLTKAEAARASGEHENLPVELFERWKAELKPGQRWWLDVPEGREEGMTNRGAVYRTFALYWLLPNLPARSERSADVVFRLATAP